MKSHWNRYWFLIALGAAALSIEGCTTVPVTGRRQLNFIPAEQEMQLGLSSFDQLKKETPINHDPAVNAMIARLR